MFKKVILNWFILATALTLIGTEAKARTTLDQPIPDALPRVKLSEILQRPLEYKDKEVLLEGNFAGICCGGGFFYKEGFDTIEIYPKGFSNPRLSNGKPIKIYGIVRVMVTSDGNVPYIEGKGLEVK